jgi:hypothetical protein
MMPERVCESCTLQKIWGCDAYDTGELDELGMPVWVNPAHLPIEVDGELTYRCPRRPIKDDPRLFSDLLFHYVLFQKGHLPDDGGTLNQSFKAMQLFGLIEDTINGCSQQQQQRERERAARAASSLRQQGA